MKNRILENYIHHHEIDLNIYLMKLVVLQLTDNF